MRDFAAAGRVPGVVGTNLHLTFTEMAVSRYA